MSFIKKKPSSAQTVKRLPAIDAMRGVVIVLMAMDHASHVFNADRYTLDSYLWYPAGAEIPALQFFVRWATHLCAPTFIFLAGFALAVSVVKRQSRGDPERAIDGDMIKRGILILILDPLWMSLVFGKNIIFQVLYAIGASLCVMAPLRRLGQGSLLVIGVGILLFGEGLAGLALWAGGGQKPGLIGALLITGGTATPNVFVLYPAIPWLAYMILGWVCGNYMLSGKELNPVRFSALAGIFCLAVFFVVRGFNQYGNMLLYRYDNSIPHWLHVSKYPPSLSFAALELGIMFLILAFCFAVYRNREASSFNPLQAFGRTPLFFYILHVHLLVLFARALNVYRSGGLFETLLATAAVLVLLYPFCRRHDRLKRARPGSLLRYL